MQAQKTRLTHPDLYVCYCNAAGAYLHLRLYPEAVQMADRCKRAAEAAFKRCAVGVCWRQQCAWASSVGDWVGRGGLQEVRCACACSGSSAWQQCM